MEFGHYQSPDVRMENAEIFSQAKVGRRTLGDHYDRFVKSFKESRVSYAAVIGAPGSGKGGVGGGLLYNLRRDERLNRAYGAGNIERVYVPYALYPGVAKAEGLIDRNKAHGQYTTEEYRASNELMYQDMQEYADEHPDKKIIYVVEGTAPLWPQVGPEDLPWNARERGLIPVRSGLEGVTKDRGSSVIYTLAAGESTRNVTQTLFIRKDNKVQNRAQGMRTPRAREGGVDLIDRLRETGVNILLEYVNGRKADFDRLAKKDPVFYKQLVEFLSQTFAPPHVMEGSKHDFYAMMKNYMEKKQVKLRSPYEEAHYKILAETLHLDRSQHVTANNQLLGGSRTFYVNTLVDSLPMRRRPHLLPDRLQRFVKT
jgi:hypothetical protein